jgi:hypothetical protein
MLRSIKVVLGVEGSQAISTSFASSQTELVVELARELIKLEFASVDTTLEVDESAPFVFRVTSTASHLFPGGTKGGAKPGGAEGETEGIANDADWRSIAFCSARRARSRVKRACKSCAFSLCNRAMSSAKAAFSASIGEHAIIVQTVCLT